MSVFTGSKGVFQVIGGMKMDKEKYERTELEIFKFQTEDVITTSGIQYEDDETELIKG